MDQRWLYFLMMDALSFWVLPLEILFLRKSLQERSLLIQLGNQIGRKKCQGLSLLILQALQFIFWPMHLQHLTAFSLEVVKPPLNPLQIGHSLLVLINGGLFLDPLRLKF